ncbi:MAG: DUF1553 domain-containing protein [Planctomycetaceae bacterium]
MNTHSSKFRSCFAASRVRAGCETWGKPLVLLAILAIPSAASAADRLEYNRDIRPILAENCFACHGPDSAARKAGLRLDRRAAALEAGAIDVDEPAESELLKRIVSTDPKQVMPPPETKKSLTPQQVATVKRWLAEGAEYQPHWSFMTPVRPALPAVKDAGWVRNDLDRFVLSNLEAHGLAPAPEADRRTLARRVALDLTGLPPAVELVEQFVADTDPNAYERLVDRLLESQRWGEHRARYWLDASRYADSHGIHFDNFREIWAYREWVIGAFNRNLPYDQFVTEQLAGDLLPQRTLDQQIASGFNRCNITTSEGGTIAEEYLVLYTRDRTETTAQVFLGLTAGCAVCHDHKFDPLSQREFYELAAFFNNTTQPAMDGNAKDTPPIVSVPLLEDRERFDQLAGAIARARQQVTERKQAARPEFDAWLKAATPADLARQIPGEGLQLHAPLTEGEGNAVAFRWQNEERKASAPNPLEWEAGVVAAKGYRSQADNVVELGDIADREKDQPFSISAWIKIPSGNAFGAIVARMDNSRDFRGWDFWLENGRIGTHLVSKWPEDAFKVTANTALEAGKWQHVTLTYDGSGKAAGVQIYYNGKLQPKANPQADVLKGSTRSEVPLKLAQRHTSEKLPGVGVQDLRFYSRVLPAPEAAQLATATRGVWLVSKPADQRSEAELNEAYDWWLATVDSRSAELTAELSRLEGERGQIAGRGTIAHVMQERPEVAKAYVLFRGEYDQRRDEVAPRTPAFLPPFPEGAPANRLGFAQWMLGPDQPLTSRVAVNRIWQELFGTGLVRTTGDFGISGELPANQQLLDWLAIEFRESGWDLKRFYKRLVMSATYRQSAQTTPAKLELDPQNRWLSRGPRFRMDAEMVRDYALATSGLLVERLGGPSVRPYQPAGVWEAVAMFGSNTRDYRADQGPNLYRRSMYTFWKRSAPPASMDVFNAPSRETCTVRRERTNTPLQALVTLNDPQFVEAARVLATRVLQEPETATDARLDRIARRILARPFTSAELEVVRPGLAQLLAHYTAQPAEAEKLLKVGDTPVAAGMAAPELAAWTMLTNQLLNLDEVLNK